MVNLKRTLKRILTVTNLGEPISTGNLQVKENEVNIISSMIKLRKAGKLEKFTPWEFHQHGGNLSLELLSGYTPRSFGEIYIFSTFMITAVTHD